MTRFRWLLLLAGVVAVAATAAPTNQTGKAAVTTNHTGNATAGTNQTAKAQTPPRLTPEQQKQLVELAKQLKQVFDDKKFADAKPLLEKMLKIQPDNPNHWYNLACAQSRLGEKEAAVKSLEVAVEKGWASFQHLERDEDLENLRKEKGYRALVARKDEIQKQRAQKINEDLQKQFGQGCLHYIDDEHRLVFATTIDQRTLDELRTTLMDYADVLGRELFTHKPERYVTVIIPKTWRDPLIGGFYNNAAALLQSKGFGHTIIHEFVHALHHGDMAGYGQEHPIWVLEGLATLFEDSDLVNGRAVPEHNHRLNYILTRAKVNRHVAWDKFLALKQPDFLRWPNYNYAQTRYMFFYLHQQGKLGTWYRYYVDNFAQDATGTLAWEKTFNKKLPDIEKDWVTWLLALSELPMRIQEGDATLGLSVTPANDGLVVARLQPEGGAAKAGLKLKDVIVRVADERVDAPTDLLKLLAGRQVGDKVPVEYRRGTEYQKTTIELTPAPSPFRKNPASPATKPEPKKAAAAS
jgi:hypothetical protein